MPTKLTDLGDGRFLEEVVGHLGVNLRQDRLAMDDQDLTKCINGDLHLQPGAIFLRRGRRKQYSTALADLFIRRLAKVNGIRYRVANTTVYRNQTAILGGLSQRLITTIVGYRPLNDTAEWAFIADDAVMKKDNGTTVQNWGIATPTATPSTAAGAGGSLTGAYAVVFTYVRKVGAAIAHESSPSPASNSTTLAAQQLSITGMTASSDAQVTHKRIYRTVAGGALYLFDQEITNATTTATSTQADSALGAEVEEDNDPPPTFSFAWEYNGHIFGTNDADNPHYVYFSKRFRPESFPTDNFLELGNPSDPLQCGVAISGVCGVFSRYTKYRIAGNDVSGFVPAEAISRRGIASPHVATPTEQGVIFVAHDGIYRTNFFAADQEISAALFPMFNDTTMYGQTPIDFARALHMASAYWKGRYFFSVPVKAE